MKTYSGPVKFVSTLLVLVGLAASLPASSYEQGDGVILSCQVNTLESSVVSFNRSSGWNTIEIAVDWSIDMSLSEAYDINCFVGVSVEITDNLYNVTAGIGIEAYDGIVRWQNPVMLYDQPVLHVEYATPSIPAGCFCKPSISVSGNCSDPYGTVSLEYVAFGGYLAF